MTQGIGGYGSDDWNRWRDEADTSATIENKAHDYCEHADSVVSGFMCDEPTHAAPGGARSIARSAMTSS